MISSIYTDNNQFLEIFNKNNWNPILRCNITDTEVCEAEIPASSRNRSLLITGYIDVIQVWNNFTLFFDPIVPGGSLNFSNLMYYASENRIETESAPCIQYFKDSDKPAVQNRVDFYLMMRFAEAGRFSLINGECTFFNGNQNYIFRLERSTETTSALDLKTLTGLKITTAGTETRSQSVSSGYIDIFQRRAW